MRIGWRPIVRFDRKLRRRRQNVLPFQRFGVFAQKREKGLDVGHGPLSRHKFVNIVNKVNESSRHKENNKASLSQVNPQDVQEMVGVGTVLKLSWRYKCLQVLKIKSSEGRFHCSAQSNNSFLHIRTEQCHESHALNI